MDAITIAAIDHCIRHRIPFIAYALPHEDKVTFIANPSGCPDGATAYASVSFFGPDAPVVPIYAECDDDTILRYQPVMSPEPDIYPYGQSTTRAAHHRAIEGIVARLRRDGGKTVLSRAIAGRRESDDWAPVIESVFGSSLFAFRFVYYTRETGCWLGASPELLGTLVNGKFTTMALAGTRIHGEPWDSKNREEHQLVVDYITGTLRSAGAAPSVGAEETVSCGPVEHLRHMISADLSDSDISFTEIIRRLSPTPALAGYPLEDALRDIAHYEAHPRHCYGGYIALHLPGGERAYVNLRSCHFHGRDYCLYAGGGITAQSDPDTEWDETEAKASALLKNF